MMPKGLLKLILSLVAVLGVILPQLSESLTEKSAALGESVSVPCPLSSPGGSVQWLQNGEPVVLDTGELSNRRHYDVDSDGTASLTILDVRKTDSGKWDCRELRSDGSVRKVANVLILTVSSVISPVAPVDPYLELEGNMLVDQATLTSRESQKLVVKCVVSGAVPPVRRIHWYIGDANLTTDSELFVEFSAEEDTYVSKSVLVVNVSRRMHNKELICKVHHLKWLQAASVSALLNVLYDPSFSISREPGFGFPIVEGMRVSLRCEVDANPYSDPLWVRDDGPLAVKQDEYGYINFSHINIDHSGWYRCTTQHEFGHFASFGYFLNVRSTSELPVSTATESKLPTYGPAVGVNCLADGRPEVIAVNKSLMAIAGKSALLAGQLCSNPRPLRVHWILRHLVLSPGDVKYPYVAYNMSETEMPDCYVSALEIRRVKLEDAGETLLVVKNAKGIADASFILNVTQASGFSISKGCQTLIPYFQWSKLCLVILVHYYLKTGCGS